MFNHVSWVLVVLAHVGDFLCCGPKADLKWFREELGKDYELKSNILGDEPGETTKMSFLKRTIELHQQGISYEGNAKYVQALLDDWNMKSCRPVVSPGVVEGSKVEKDEALSKEEALHFRRGAATLNYVALDRPDISFSTKEICRAMSVARANDLVKVKRIPRYLRGAQRLPK